MENNNHEVGSAEREIIPLPWKIDPREGHFKLSPDTIIFVDPFNSWNANYLRNLLASPTGFSFEIRNDNHHQKCFIQLALNSNLDSLGYEGYRLEILPNSILIESAGTAGVFYGIQTLRQLFPIEMEGTHEVIKGTRKKYPVPADRRQASIFLAGFHA